MSFHITQCPSCESTFNVTARILETAQGRVRCGACLTIFEAPENLIERDEALAEEESVFVGSHPDNYFDPSTFLTRQSLQEAVADAASSTEYLEDSDADNQLVDIGEATAEYPDEPVTEPVEKSVEKDWEQSVEGHEEESIEEESTEEESTEEPAHDFESQASSADLEGEEKEQQEEKKEKEEEKAEEETKQTAQAKTSFSHHSPNAPRAPYSPFGARENGHNSPESFRMHASFSVGGSESTSNRVNSEAATSNEADAKPPETIEHEDVVAEQPFTLIDIGEEIEEEVEEETGEATTEEFEEAVEQSISVETENEEFLIDWTEVIGEDFVAEKIESETDKQLASEHTNSEEPHQSEAANQGIDGSSVTVVEDSFDESVEDSFGTPAEGSFGTSAEGSFGTSAEGSLEDTTEEPAEDAVDHSVEAIRARALKADLQDDEALEAIPDENLQALGKVSTPVEIVAARQRSLGKQIAWTSAALLSGLVLGLQYLWQEMERFSQNTLLRPLYANACQLLECDLPEYADIEAIRASNLAVRSHPDMDNALAVNIEFQNFAPFEQSFPILILSFNSANNSVIALREFAASEYLPEQLQNRRYLPPRTPVQVDLNIIDPGDDAVNYTLAFRRP